MAALETGAWICLTSDAKSGMLFGVKEDKTVTVTLLTEEMVKMLGGKKLLK